MGRPCLMIKVNISQYWHARQRMTTCHKGHNWCTRLLWKISWHTCLTESVSIGRMITVNAGTLSSWYVMKLIMRRWTQSTSPWGKDEGSRISKAIGAISLVILMVSHRPIPGLLKLLHPHWWCDLSWCSRSNCEDWQLHSIGSAKQD